MMDSSKLENDLVSELKLSNLQAKVYLLVTCYGGITKLSDCSFEYAPL